MQDMIVVTYDNVYSAQDTMNVLRSLNDNWIVDLYDAVTVERDVNGKLNIQDSYKTTTKAGAGWGVLFGTLLGGLVLAPFTGGLSAATATGAVAAGAVGGAAIGGLTGAAAASFDKDDFGLPDDFVDEVSTSIKPGNSAIFALVENRDPEQVANFFRGSGGKIIRTSLTPEQQKRAQQILAGKQ
jgi:uncharacterized membrane protein